MMFAQIFKQDKIMNAYSLSQIKWNQFYFINQKNIVRNGYTKFANIIKKDRHKWSGMRFSKPTKFSIRLYKCVKLSLLFIKENFEKFSENRQV